MTSLECHRSPRELEKKDCWNCRCVLSLKVFSLPSHKEVRTKKDNQLIRWKNEDTDHNAAVAPSRKARTNQTRHKVGRRWAVVPADPWWKGSHYSLVEVEGAVVCRVWVQSTESCLPDLKIHETKLVFMIVCEGEKSTLHCFFSCHIC